MFPLHLLNCHQFLRNKIVDKIDTLMAQGRGLFTEICKNFVNSLKPKRFWGELKGKDYQGTEYYEAPATSRGKRPSRWFMPLDGKSFDIDKPPEWETWLRHVRKEAPTEEEIQLNLQKRMAAVENAKKLERRKTEGEGEMKTFEKPAFPVYEEYNLGPADKENRKEQQ